MFLRTFVFQSLLYALPLIPNLGVSAQRAELPDELLKSIESQSKAVVKCAIKSVEIREMDATSQLRTGIVRRESSLWIDNGKFREELTSVHAIPDQRNRLQKSVQAFDGTTFFLASMTNSNAVISKLLGENSDLSAAKSVELMLTYLDAAGVFVPRCVADLRTERIGSMVGYYLENAELVGVSRADSRLKIDFHHSVEPVRDIHFELDPKYGYAVVSRAESIDGRVFLSVVNEKLKFFREAAIWLPQECSVEYNFGPGQSPLKSKILLTRMVFSVPSTIEFAVNDKRSGTLVLDQSTKAAQESPHGNLTYKFDSKGTPQLRESSTVNRTVSNWWLVAAGCLLLTVVITALFLRTSPWAIDTAHRRRGFTIVELMVVILIVGVLLGLLLPAIQMSREATRRVTCANNLRSLGLAVHSFESAHGSCPSGGWGKLWSGIPSQGVGPSQPGGWIYQVLPFLEQQSLFNMGGGHSTDAQENSKRLSTPLAVLHCPTRRSASLFANAKPWIPHLHTHVPLLARNDYAINGGSVYIRCSPGPDSVADAKGYPWADLQEMNGLCHQLSAVKLSHVTDGLSNTILLGEKQVPKADYQTGNNWGDNESAYSGDDRDQIRYTGYGHWPLSDFEEPTPSHYPTRGTSFGSAHRSIFQVLFTDGSLHPLSYAIDELAFCNLGRRNDGAISNPEN